MVSLGRALTRRRVLGATVAAAAAGVATAVKVRRDRAARKTERQRRAFRLEADQGATAGIRRIARGQVDDATDHLRGRHRGNRGDAIHEARKSCKRLRALARLVRDQLGEDVYQRENATFRDAGRTLSGARDATVLVETLDALRERFHGEIGGDHFGGLRAALADDHRAAQRRLRDRGDQVRAVDGVLQAARDRIATWPLDDGATSYRVLAPGFERIYRGGRRALRAAEKEITDETLHELRKRTKDLWHAAQIVQPAAPKRMGKLARRAHALSDVIGDDHDLAVLDEVAAARREALSRHELELLRGLIARRRRVLQREALKRARKLYGPKPRSIVRPLAAA